MDKIEEKRPEVSSRADQWERCRKIVEGTDAVHAHDLALSGRGPNAFIHRLEGQRNADYERYVLRATFYNATFNTIQSFVGLAFGTPPEAKIPTGASEIVEDADMAGSPLAQVAERSLREVLKVGRAGLFVDLPPSPPGLSAAQAKEMGIRPFVVLYNAESIINWTFSRIGGKTRLARLVLAEPGEGGSLRYRELLLGELAPELAAAEGLDALGRAVYSIRVWEKAAPGAGKEAGYVVTSTAVPRMKSEPLDFIPFFPLAPSGEDWRTARPPLLDLVDMNLSHYRTMADLEHGRFFLGIPTPVFAGFDFNSENKEEGGEVDVRLGSPEGIVTRDPNAKWGFLEFTGAGIGALERAAEAKEKMMAALGASYLTDQKLGVESGEALKIRTHGSASALAGIVSAVSRGISQALDCMVRWAGFAPADGEVSFSINDDFTPSGLSAQELEALVKAVQAGQLPRFDFFRALVKGKVIAPDRTYDDFVAETPEPGALALLGAETGASKAGAPGQKAGSQAEPGAQEGKGQKNPPEGS